MASVSAVWSPYLSARASTPYASLTFLTSSTTRKSSVSLSGAAAAHSPLLHCSFISSAFSVFCLVKYPSFMKVNFLLTISLVLATMPIFLCLSLGLDLSSSVGVGRKRGSGLVVKAGKAALCLSKRSRSRKSLAQAHGFRRRMRTTGGRAMMKRRRAKGRKVLCTKSNPSSGKRA
ncbi:large ribosomal subunit protein bL34c-like [Malus domestica]|uniref:large ribosomal subunit protein bL34c-like n=1 Tax=Malus domestica TaxID=3750 RepID=UPI00397571A1